MSAIRRFSREVSGDGVGARTRGGLRARGFLASLLLALAACLWCAAPGLAAPTAAVPDWAHEATTTSPSAREGAAMAYDPATRQMVLFGGYDEAGLRHDTWTYDGLDWTEQSPATSPSAREVAAMAYDPAIGEMVLFGGNGDGFQGDTWTWNGSEWTERFPADSPSPRGDAAMAFDPATGQMVLFGGDAAVSSLDDTWTYDGVNWTEQSPTTSPPARQDATMAYDPAIGRLVLFGGDGENGIGNDTWTYEGDTWTEQSPAARPPGRVRASMAYDAATGKMVLFGGVQGGGLGNETWAYEGDTWTEQSPQARPQGRERASMAYDPATGKMVLFGGDADSGLLDETWTYGIPSHLSTDWTRASPAESPAARNGAAMAFDSATGQMVLFGGQNKFGDTWTYDGGEWTERSPATSPSPRYDAAMAFDSATGQMVLFGGLAAGGTPELGETWIWDGGEWTEHSPADSPSPREGASMVYDAATGELVLFGGWGEGVAHNDTWTWNGDKWTERSPATSPPGRERASMAYDAASGQVVLFGGETVGGSLHDTWTWEGDEWTPQSPVTSPPSRFGAPMTYDPATGQMILFGGDSATASFGDTWTWGGGEWTELAPATSPSPRYDPSMAYDPATGRIVLFGGLDETHLGEPTHLDETWTYQPIVGAPTATITSPAGGGTYTVGKPVTTAFECDEAPGGPGIESCTDSGGKTAGSGDLDTGTPGEGTYTVTALSKDGEVGRAEIHFTVAKTEPALTTSFLTRPSLGGELVPWASLTGGWESGGSVTLRLYGPETVDCAGAPLAEETVPFSFPNMGNNPVNIEGPVITAAEAGTYTLLAEYSGDQNNGPASSSCGEASASVIVGKVESTTSLEVTPSPVAPDQTVTVTAHVTGAAPTGTVTFTDGSATLGSAELVDGTATLTTTGLAAGAHLLAASYEGDSDNLPSTSPTIEETVTAPAPPPPTKDIGASANPPARVPKVRISYSPDHPHSPDPEGGPRWTFRFGDGKAGGTYLCSLDAARLRHCASPKIYRHLKVGRHVFRVRSVATDGAESPAQIVKFMVGTTKG